MKKLLVLTLAAGLMALTTFAAHARDQIRIVGSSTVYPFASYVAEEFGATTGNPTPIIESTGSGGGHKLFSQGVDLNTPDITNSSRRMKTSEFDKNMDAGVKKIVEVVIGYDGIAVAFNNSNPDINLTRKDITLAVAEEVPVNGKLVPNPYKNWNEINSSLPNRPILIYGPPTSSGTRDAFEELVMEATTKKMAGYGNKKYKKIRQDGLYVPAGENDNLIVQKLAKDKEAFGIFGYSFLEENSDRLKGAMVDGVKPVPAKISSGEYPVSRSLFFYVKVDHLSKVDGLEEFVDMFLSEMMIGTDGLLKSIGLIPLPADERDALRARWEKRQLLTKADLAH
ncbi:MAG: phosphate-binding protein [Denitrovibrio sp.]|nr:MAG: phosphate-binding protein [Denitrovibrio sp.]